MIKKQTVLIFVFLLITSSIFGQNTIIKGIVSDSITGERLSYASLIIKGTTVGTATDENGTFSFSPSTTHECLVVSYLGYNTQEIKFIPGQTNQFNIRLKPNGVTLKEVTIKPKRERYSKKDSPAVELVKRVIALREKHDPKNHDYYHYNQYEKILLALNEYKPKEKSDGKNNKFDFLVDYIDTLEMGTTILPVLEKEKVETVLYRKEPRTERRIIQGFTSSGVDEMLSRDGVQQFLNEVFREVNIFQNDIPLFLQRFVSPLSSIGPNFYKYYLLDTLDIEGETCVDLGFVPFNSETFGFTGHLYVTLDSTYFVKKAILNVPKDINLNFVSRMTIEQTFKRTSDHTRIITKDDIHVNFKLSERSKGLYARRLNKYSQHSFLKPPIEQLAVFKEKQPIITIKEAYQQPENFWVTHRPQEAIRKNPNSVGMLMKKLRSVPVFYFTEKAISILFSGYIPTHKEPLKSKFELGPMNSTIGGNELEGFRTRVGGTTTTAFHKNLFLDGYLAYGTKDQKLKYDLLVEYSFNKRKEYRKEFPLNSIRIEYMYDVNKLGEQYMYTGKDNMLLSIKRLKDTRATYLRQAELVYNHEHYNGLSYSITLRNRREYVTEYAAFDYIKNDGSITPIKKYDMTQLEFKIRYAKNEKFYQTRDLRIPITFDALIFNFSHIMAKKDFLGSDYDYHRTEIGVQKRFWFSAFGYLDIITKAGKVWSQVPYPLLILPNANMSYTIQPETYSNMNALEFINDEFTSWDMTYYMNGNLLNRIPLIKKLKWREVFCFRGLWGHLSDKNNPFKEGEKEGLFLFPLQTYQMDKTPYMEASVGIENIFSCLRVDYVWRLNYLDHPNIQKSGIRCTIQLSF